MFHVKPGADAAALSELAPAPRQRAIKARGIHDDLALRFASDPRDFRVAFHVKHRAKGAASYPCRSMTIHVKHGANRGFSIFTEPHNRPGSNVPRESVAGGARRVGYSHLTSPP